MLLCSPGFMWRACCNTISASENLTRSQSCCQIHQRPRKCGIVFDCLSKDLFRCSIVPLLAIKCAEVVLRIREIRFQCNRSLEFLFRSRLLVWLFLG